MDNNILKDEKLDELGYIKNIDLYSIVDREFDKKRERKRIREAVGISTLVIIFILLIVCLIIILPNSQIQNAKLIKLLVGYYFISVSMMMLLIIPIRKRKNHTNLKGE